jgi:LCP family protein required for cell wall assembly
VVLVAGLVVICLLTAMTTGLLALEGGQRTNLLLLGVDRRDGDGWAYRTDTIMLVTLDRETRSAGLLSIPRDLQVSIPGYGEDRINTANVYGSLDSSEGGPRLLRETIEANFRIPVDGYLMVDFYGFERVIDVLGGIEVDVPEVLHDTRYPDPRPGDPHAYKTIHFEAGRQQMDGARALEYARSRMSTSDFDRAKRQQLILLAIRERALSVGGILRWPALARTVVDSVRTDTTLRELLAAALTVVRLDMSSARQVVLEHPLVVPHRRGDGAAVQLPNWSLIDPVLEELFGLRPAR